MRPALDPVLDYDSENRSGCVKIIFLQLALSHLLEEPVWPGKKMVISYFADVRNIVQVADRYGYLVRKDESDCELIENKVNGVINLGSDVFRGCVDIISLADTLVCNDSGLMHVSAALNTKTVALFGSTSDEYIVSSNSLVVSREMDCRPCFQRVCPLGHMDS